MVALGIVELEGTRDRVEHRLRGAGEIAAFQPGVVLDADAGEQRDLGAAKTGDAAVRAGGQIDLVGPHLRPARREELTNVVPVAA